MKKRTKRGHNKMHGYLDSGFHANDPALTTGPFNSGHMGANGPVMFGFGGTLGSIFGAAAGSLIPIPGVGTMIGQQVGSAIGSSFDRKPQQQIQRPQMSTPPYIQQGLYTHGGPVQGSQGIANLYEDGGMIPIEAEGSGVSEGTQYALSHGELLVTPNGRVLKNYVAGNRHKRGGIKTMEQPGNIVIPRNRSNEYMNSDMNKRKDIIRSIKSKQEDRTNKALKQLSSQGFLPEGVYSKGGMLYCEQGGEVVEYGKGGGIHINPENKGKFTAAANRAGMGVQEYARHVLSNPNASGTLKKRANFARNAAKWHHENGGVIKMETGGDYGLGDLYNNAKDSLNNSDLNTVPLAPILGYVAPPSSATDELPFYKRSTPISPLMQSEGVNSGAGLNFNNLYGRRDRFKGLGNFDSGMGNTRTPSSNTGLTLADGSFSTAGNPNGTTVPTDGKQRRPLGDTLEEASTYFPYAKAAYQGFRWLTDKPVHLNPDYVRHLNPNLIPEETGKMEIQDAYHTGLYNLKSSGRYSKAGQAAIAGQRMKQDWNRRLDLRTRNTGIMNETAARNADIDRGNAESKWRAGVFNAESDAAKRNAGDAFFDTLSTIGQENRQNDFNKRLLSEAYPDLYNSMYPYSYKGRNRRKRGV